MSEEVTISGETSDGYHTFNELYDHRCHLFAALMLSYLDISWKSKHHADGSAYEGWFICGMHLPTGDISYHLPESMWDQLDRITTQQFAPEWDGHTSVDVVKRLSDWLKTI